jgi:hypothetical protein
MISDKTNKNEVFEKLIFFDINFSKTSFLLSEIIF